MTTDARLLPVLLSGGAGTRLWPLSRESFPKQFAPLTSARTPFQATALRLTGEGFAAPLVITGAAYRFTAAQQLAAEGLDPAALLLEPEGRNTAAPVLLAALWQAEHDPEGLVLIAPTDHAIRDENAFRAALSSGIPAAQEGAIVTFGVCPDRAETGYGWLHAPGAGHTPRPVQRFTEKPDATRAQEMFESGGYLWNAGLFLARASTLIAAFHAHAPDLVAPVTESFAKARPDLGFLRLDPAAWQDLRAVSVDVAIMEKAAKVIAVPLDAGWSDLGDWAALRAQGSPDENGVLCQGPALGIGCEDVLLRSEDPDVQLVGIGLKNLIAVAMPDAVLVADANRSQEVKDAVAALRAQGASQATTLPRRHRPWGWYETLATGPRFQVKRIRVAPGGRLSLQAHHHRAEHWTVVMGTAKVTLEQDTFLLSENQSTYIPQGAVHRLENPGKLPVTLIEVQSGAYLGEDDIIRFSDSYARD